MNTIRTRTLIYKDLRRFWPNFLIAVLLLLAPFISLPLLDDYLDNVAPRMRSLIVVALFWAFPTASISSILHIVHDAPPSGATEFWKTRPISGTQLFVSKYVIIVLFFALLPSLALITAEAIGLAPCVCSDHETCTRISSVFSILLVGTLCVMLLASLTSDKREFTLSLLSIAICTMALLVINSKKSPDISLNYIQNENLYDWVMTGASCIGLSAIIYYQYVKRKRIVTLAATALLAIVLIGIWQSWPVGNWLNDKIRDGTIKFEIRTATPPNSETPSPP